MKFYYTQMPIQLSSATGYLRKQQNSISMIITMITPKEGECLFSVLLQKAAYFSCLGTEIGRNKPSTSRYNLKRIPEHCSKVQNSNKSPWEDFSELEGDPCQAVTRTDVSHDGQSGADRLLTMQWHDVRSTLQLILAKKHLHREE